MSAEIAQIVISLVFGGGIVAAVTAFRKAGTEAESISVTTLRGVIEELRSELARKDVQITNQDRQIGKLMQRIENLEERLLDDPPSHLS